MFQKRCRQRTMFEVAFLVPSEKRVRLEASWAQGFQEKALPIIEEDAFRELYCEDNGAPNKAVQIVLGALLLKEMSNLTDEETVARVEFDLRWQHALRLTPEEAHVSSKTLYNFRMRLVKSDGGRKAFESVCSGVLRALGVSVARQRLDSTYVCSNVARVSRLGLFCEVHPTPLYPA